MYIILSLRKLSAALYALSGKDVVKTREAIKVMNPGQPVPSVRLIVKWFHDYKMTRNLVWATVYWNNFETHMLEFAKS